MIEPVQGEGGFVVAPQEFLDGVRKICDDNGIVLVVDEVQTGFGRTGKMWGIEHYGIEPDLMCVAKSIAAGLPLSGVLGRAEIMDAPGDSAIGGTYVGNPVAQAAALAVLDVFEEDGLVDRAAQIGDAIRERMHAWQQRWPAIGDVRGLGSWRIRRPGRRHRIWRRASWRRPLSAGCSCSSQGSTRTASASSSRSSSRMRSSTKRSASGKTPSPQHSANNRRYSPEWPGS